MNLDISYINMITIFINNVLIYIKNNNININYNNINDITEILYNNLININLPPNLEIQDNQIINFSILKYINNPSIKLINNIFDIINNPLEYLKNNSLEYQINNPLEYLKNNTLEYQINNQINNYKINFNPHYKKYICDNIIKYNDCNKYNCTYAHSEYELLNEYGWNECYKIALNYHKNNKCHINCPCINNI